MYTVNKTRSRKKLFLTFVITLSLFFGLMFAAVWYFILRDTDSNAANFSRTGGTIAVVELSTEVFTTDEYKVTLPSGWKYLGKENPKSDEEYYYYQSQIEEYTNRWLKVYVDVYPQDYQLTRLMPITVTDGKIDPGLVSNDCKTFDGAPKQGSQASKQPWTAIWEGISFNCNMTNVQNHIGTATAKDGYGVPIAGDKSGTHKYFFVYIDHNIRPDYSIFSNALESFVAL